MVAWLALRQTATQCKGKMRYLCCGLANTQAQPHTFTHTNRQTHMSPLLKGRLPAYPACFAHFLCVCNTCLCGDIICWIQGISLQHIICACVMSYSKQMHILSSGDKRRETQPLCKDKIMGLNLPWFFLSDDFQPQHPAFPFLSLLTGLSQCFSLFQSCEILSGKPVRISVSRGHFPRESQIFHSSLAQHVAIGRASLWASAGSLSLCTPPSGHPQALHFFPSPIFQNSLPNECWPIPFPAIKTGSGGRRCLENVVIIAYTHTLTYAEAPLR